MRKSKVIYRDKSSNRLITRQQAEKRDPETWVEEVFTPSDNCRTPPRGRTCRLLDIFESIRSAGRACQRHLKTTAHYKPGAAKMSPAETRFRCLLLHSFGGGHQVCA